MQLIEKQQMPNASGKSSHEWTHDVIVDLREYAEMNDLVDVCFALEVARRALIGKGSISKELIQSYYEDSWSGIAKTARL